MGKTDELFVTVDTDAQVLRVDDPKEEATEGATMDGDVVKEDGRMIVESAAEVQVLSPQVLFLNEDNNSLIAVPDIPLDVGITAVLRLGHRSKNSKSIFAASSLDPSDGFFPFAFDGVLFLVVNDGMVDCG